MTRTSLDELWQQAVTYAATPKIDRMETALAERLKLPSDVTLQSFLSRNHRADHFPTEDRIFIVRVRATRQDQDTDFDVRRAW